MRIAILDLTEHPLPLMQGLPRAGDLIERWLSPALPEARFAQIDVAEGGADMPALDAFDGLVIGGSEYGVYDDTPWMGPLRDLILQIRAARKPVYGICFGHQIMADCWGGRAEKAPTGLIVGARRFRIGARAHQAHVWHRDQVTRVPEGARIAGDAPYCPVGVLDYDFAARSVQFHPEYDRATLLDLLERGRGRFIDAQTVRAAEASLRAAQVAADLESAAAARVLRARPALPETG